MVPRFTALEESQQRAKIKTLCALLETENAAYDINAYKAAPAGLRIWGGATVQPEDIAAALPWIEWAFHEVIK